MKSSMLLQGTVLLAASLTLAGCGSNSNNNEHPQPAQLPPLPAGTYANWQFQTGNSLTAGAVILLSGPLETTSGAVSGQLVTSAPCSQTEPRAFAGALNATTGALTLATTTTGISGQFTMASATSGTGTLAGGALGYDSGVTCLALIGPTPAIAVQIPTLTGTYKGTVASSSATPVSSSVTLNLTQSTTPNTSAAFPLTASLQYTAGSCSASYALSGSISGASYSLAGATAADPSITGLDSNNGQTLPAVSIVIPTGSCATAGTYTGTLTLQ